MIAVIPAFAASSNVSGIGKKASDASALPCAFSPACVIAILQNLHGSSVQHRHQLSYHLLLKQLHLISHALQLSKLVLNLSILALKVHVSLELKLYFHLMITYLPLEREGHLVQKLIFACACRFFNIYS